MIANTKRSGKNITCYIFLTPAEEVPSVHGYNNYWVLYVH